jgi:hypothetical protein
MDTGTLLRGIAAFCIAGLIAAVSANAGSTTGQAWMANGGSACEKYLTPEVLAAILIKPVGTAERLDATSCRAAGVYISLQVSSVQRFKLQLPQIIGTHPLVGVGDMAYWNQAGAVSAVKGNDRGCAISVIGAPAKIHDEALGLKLGEICNKLFALN